MAVDLSSKRALVTGASRGLGQATCRVYAELGARVAFSFSRDQAGARDTLEAIREHGEGMSFAVSVLDGAGTEEMVDRIRLEWGGIDVLVNNAGISQPLPIALLEEEDWDRVMDVNVKGTFLTTRAVLRVMIRQRSGVILNIGSVAGLRALDAPVHYCASKAAVAGFTTAVAKQVASAAAGEGARISHQVFGAIGVTEEHELHHLTRRLWQWRQEAGSEYEWSEVVGNALMGAGGDALWPALVGDRHPLG